MAKGILRVKLLGDAGELNKTLDEAGGKLEAFGGKAKLAAAAVGAAVVAAGVAAVKFAFDTGVQFDEAMDTIRVGTGATGAALADLGESFKTVFKGVPADANEVAQAIADLNTRTGATGDTLEDMARKAVILSQITGEDLGGQIAATTRAFGSFGVAVEDQGAAMDSLWKVSQATGIGVTELGEKMAQFGAPLRQLGFDFEQTAALIGKFEQEGVNSEAVLAGLKKGLATFAKAGEEPAEALTRATEAIKNAGSAAEANQIAIQVFGARAGPEMAAAIREGRFELTDFLGTLRESSETIDKAGEDIWDFGEKWKMLKNKIMVAIEPIGTILFEGLGKVVDWVSGALEPVIGFFASMADKAKESGLGLGMLSDALSLLNPIMGIFKEMWPALLPLMRQVADLWIELAAQVLPIMAEAWHLVMETVSPILQAFLDMVMRVFPTILETIRTVMNAILPIIQGVLGFLQSLWQEHGDRIMAIVRTVFGIIETVIQAAMGVIQGVINLVMGILTGDWERAWEGVKQIFGSVWDGIKGIITGAMSAVKDIVLLAVGVIKSVWEATWNGIKTVAEGIWNGIKAAASTVWNSIKATLTGVWDSIKEAFGRLWDGMKGIWETAAGWIASIPGKIKGFFIGAGRWLYDIGKEILEGLWNGLKAVWDKVSGWFSSIGGWIKKLKGPIDKDRQMLYPEGVAIMEGFGEGLQDGWQTARGALTGIKDDMGRMFAASDTEVQWGLPGAGAFAGGYQTPGAGRSGSDWASDERGRRKGDVYITIESIVINGGTAEAEEAAAVLTTRLQALGVMA